jgi:hypothetical protein
VRGRARVIGSIASGGSIELIGPAEDILSATALVGFTGSKTANLESAVYMTGLLSLVAPEWKEGNDWLIEHMKIAQESGEKQETTVNDKLFSIIVLKLDSGSLVTFTIKSTSY